MEKKKHTHYEAYLKHISSENIEKPKETFTEKVKDFFSGIGNILSFFLAVPLFFGVIYGAFYGVIWGFNYITGNESVDDGYEVEDSNKDGIVTEEEYEWYHKDISEQYNGK